MGTGRALARAEDLLRKLVRELLDSRPGWLEPFQPFVHRIAIYNIEVDADVSSCRAYAAATEALVSLPHFRERYGEDAASRLTIQFVYTYLARVLTAEYAEDVFTQTWQGFLEELRDPEWHFVGVANLTNFNSNMSTIDLGDGISIRHRVVADLRRDLGWSDWEIEQLQNDWSGPGASSYIFYLEENVPKEPSNLILQNTATASLRRDRSAHRSPASF